MLHLKGRVIHVDHGLLRRMFNYMAEPQLSWDLHGSDVIFVFGRCDRRVALRAAAAYHFGWARKILVSGGIGKDSGDLAARGLSEAQWLAGIMTREGGVPPHDIMIEDQATNGGENCRLGLDVLAAAGLTPRRIHVVAHATSLRRLTALLRDELANRGLNVPVAATPTTYPFDPANPADAAEVVAEVRRLIEWPAKGWLSPQSVPQEFVDAVMASN